MTQPDMPPSPPPQPPQPEVPPPEPIDATAQLASTVGEQLKTVLENPDELAGMDAAAIVALVLDGVNQVQAGDPLGMVRRDPDGVVYIRVNDSGVHKWRVVDPNDGSAQTFDMRSLDYPIIHDTNGEQA